MHLVLENGGCTGSCRHAHQRLYQAAHRTVTSIDSSTGLAVFSMAVVLISFRTVEGRHQRLVEITVPCIMLAAVKEESGADVCDGASSLSSTTCASAA